MKAWKIVKRRESLGWVSFFILVSAISVALGLSSILLALQGKPLLEATYIFFSGAFGSSWAIQDCLVKAIPIFLCSMGVAITFRLQIWNIGAEGQFALGAIAATWAALSFPQMPWFFLLPLMLIAASIGGGLWGLIPALLRIRLGVNEIIVTLMLNYIAIFFLDFLVYGVWKDPTSFGMPMTSEFSENAIVGFIGDTGLSWGILLCLAIAIIVSIFFRYTRLGFELKASGENMRAARYARLPYNRLVVMVMICGGALAGWAGFLEASSSLNRLQPSIMAGYGYTAIVVAWLAKLNPFSISIASFLLAGLRVGVENLQLDLQVPAAFGGIMEGLILLSVLAGDFFNRYQIKARGKKS